MSASLSEVVKTVYFSFYLKNNLSECCNTGPPFFTLALSAILGNREGHVIFLFILDILFLLGLKIRSLSLKSDIIRLFLYIDCFLLFFPFPFTHSWKFLLISWNFSSIISISKYIYFQFRLSDSIYQGHQSPLH